MDSVTQAVLGAAVGQAMMGKKVGRMAPIVGALVGTFPDLDVLIPFGGAVENFTYHRSFSHSLIVLFFMTPVIVWLLLKLRPSTRKFKNAWGATVLAIFWTHVLLDALTVYGTQLFWPISSYPVGISSVFIIDPFYTVPLIITLIYAGAKGWSSDRAHRASVLGLLVSSFYLTWTLSAKAWLHETVEMTASQKGIENYQVLTTPMPLQSVLWRVILVSQDEYHIAHMKPWDDPAMVDLKSYDKGEYLLAGLEDNWDVERLRWFTKGFYRVEKRAGDIVISDLRMGVEGSYAFNFAVASEQESGAVAANEVTRVEDKMDITRLRLVWERLFDPSVSLHPELGFN